MFVEPEGLQAGGLALWTAITEAYEELDPAQQVQLLEVCRAKDRLDQLDDVLCGRISYWSSVEQRGDTNEFVLVINSALDKANVTANVMKQLLAAMRLPDLKSGKRPQMRSARGTQLPSVPTASSALERARNKMAS